jgi:CW_7 repeat
MEFISEMNKAFQRLLLRGLEAILNFGEKGYQKMSEQSNVFDQEQQEKDKPEGAITSENLANAQEVPVEEPDPSKVDEDAADEEEDDDLESTGENSITEVAKAVLRGDWGQGQEQRQRLSEAGYNANEVQEEVTRLRNS